MFKEEGVDAFQFRRINPFARMIFGVLKGTSAAEGDVCLQHGDLHRSPWKDRGMISSG